MKRHQRIVQLLSEDFFVRIAEVRKNIWEYPPY